MSKTARRTLRAERLVFALIMMTFAAGLLPTTVIGPASMAIAGQEPFPVEFPMAALAPR